MTVSEIMTREVVWVRPHTTIKEVAKTLYLNHLTGVPVLDASKKLVGIITEGDIVMRDSHVHIPQVIQILDSFIYPTGIAEMEREMAKITALEAQQLMTREVMTVTPETSVEDLATLMMDHNANPVPVVDADGAVVGIVSKSDLVWLLARDPQEKKS